MATKITKFSFQGKVWRWPGYGGWHFVTLPKDTSKKIKALKKSYGAGFVKTKVTLGKSSWDTALFQHKESDSYLLSIKKNIRKKESIFEDDNIKITITL